MKLLSCHIDNFGTFHDFDMKFADGLNVILQDNGWGKTTLAAFLKAMLYGFDSRRTRDITENERRRYIPWQGGRYGGTLDFEVGGKQYRIQRTFGEVPRNDRCRVTELATGLPCSQMGDNVGEWLFHLDAAAFQRSVYIPSSSADSASGQSGLHARLNALVSEVNDVSKFDAAMAQLEQRRKFYEKTGNRGEIAEISRQIAECQQEKRRCESMISEIARIRDRILELDEQLKLTEGKIADCRRETEKADAAKQKIQAALNIYADMQKQLDDLETKIRELVSSIGSEFPDEKMLADVDRQLNICRQLKERIDQNTHALEAAQKTLSSIKENYNGTIPHVKAVAALRSSAAEAQRCKDALSVHKSKAVVGQGMNARLHNYIAQQPNYLEECNVLLAAWPSMDALQKSIHEQELRIPYEEKLWQDQNQKYKELAGRVDACEKAAGQQPDRRKMSFSDAHRILSEEEESSQQLKNDRLILDRDPDRFERESLDDQFRGNTPSDIEIKELSAEIDGCARLRVEIAQTESDLRGETQKHETLCAEFETLKRNRDNAVVEEPIKPKTQKVMGAVFLIAVLIAVVLAFVQETMMIPLLGTAGILGIVAVALLVIYRKKLADYNAQMTLLAQQRSEEETLCKKAEESCSAQRNVCLDMEACLTSQRTAFERMQQKNDEYLRRWFPEILPGDERRHFDILAARLIRWKELNTVHERRKQAETELAERQRRIDSAIEQVCTYYPELRNLSLHDAIVRLSRMDADAETTKRELAEARSSLLKFILDSSRKMPIPEGDGIVCNKTELARVRELIHDKNTLLTVVKTINLLNARTSDVVRKIKAEIKEHSAQLQAYFLRMEACLLPLDLRIDSIRDLSVGIDQLRRILVNYQQYADTIAAQKTREAELENRLRDAEGNLNRQLNESGIHCDADALEIRLEQAESDGRNAEKLLWDIQRMDKELKNDAESMENTRRRIHASLHPFMKDSRETPENTLHRLRESSAAIGNLRSERQALREQMKKFASEHGIDPSIHQTTTSDRQSVPNEQNRALILLQQGRDALIQEKAQCNERIRQINLSLERYPVVEQNLKLLYAKRQAAAANLFAVQRTMQLLKSAKDSLAVQYLGHIEGYFNVYLHVWLGTDALTGKIDTDFHVTLHEGDIGHLAEGYSTGYCDVIDMCMRMALIRTLFDKEKPFVIMDDPFVNLDASRLANALGFIRTFAEDYQLIYFACHSVRTFDAIAPATMPILPKLSAAVRPEVRKQPSAAGKTVQKATYSVIPGRTGIIPIGAQKRITNNIFTLRFEPEDTNDTAEKQYEVFFIDEKERILSDRQIIESAFAQLTPASVRFCLNTREDSGKLYSLIVRDTAQPENEIIRKFTYESAISFAAEFDF